MAVGRAIGIDLGTTNSCAAIVEAGQPRVIKSRLGHTTIPSVVTFDDQGKPVVGQPAERRMMLQPEETIYGSKRLVGRVFLKGVRDRFQKHFHYELVPDDEGFVAAQLSERIVPLLDAQAMILQEIRRSVELSLEDTVQRAVITVPAYFNENQRAFVRQAGERAGLEVIRVVNEPTAAALAFGSTATKQKQRLLVFDLGGGTFDVSLLEVEGNVFNVIGVDGDTFLGGIDFDRRVADWLADRIAEQHNVSLRALDMVSRERLRTAAQSAKHHLSGSLEAMLQIPHLQLPGGKTVDVNQPLDRQTFNQLTAELVDQTMTVVRRVLDNAAVRPASIDEILLVGGQTRTPALKKRLTDYFGKEPNQRVHPDEVVALGAAIAAYSRGQPDAAVLHDVVPLPIGLAEPDGRFLEIIAKNTRVPHDAIAGVTAPAGADTLRLAVFQGERSHALDNEFLGSLQLDDIGGNDDEVECELLLRLDDEGMLTLRARAPTLGIDREAKLATIQTPDQILAEMGRERIQVSLPSVTTDSSERATGALQQAWGAGARKQPARRGILARLFGWLLRR